MYCFHREQDPSTSLPLYVKDAYVMEVAVLSAIRLESEYDEYALVVL